MTIMRCLILVASSLVFAACAGEADERPVPAGPAQTLFVTRGSPLEPAGDQVRPFTPGVDPEPLVVRVPARRASFVEAAAFARLNAELSDPNRSVFHARERKQNVVAGGNGEAVGLFTSPTFAAAGSVVNIGVQKNFPFAAGGNFYHTHEFVNNQCFEYGINYSQAPPTLFAYNWCTGGNTPQGFINAGLVGDPGGVLQEWEPAGYGWLFHWDAANQIREIALEEVQRADGWHLLGYNWSAGAFEDIMNGIGVTGRKGACCGWSVFENHVSSGATCAFDVTFPKGRELLYDAKMEALIGTTWMPLNTIPNGGFYFGTRIDCANISGIPDPGYVSPYFSGGYVAPTAAVNPGQWWMIQE